MQHAVVSVRAYFIIILKYTPRRIVGHMQPTLKGREGYIVKREENKGQRDNGVWLELRGARA